MHLLRSAGGPACRPTERFRWSGVIYNGNTIGSFGADGLTTRTTDIAQRLPPLPLPGYAAVACFVFSAGPFVLCLGMGVAGLVLAGSVFFFGYSGHVGG